MSDILDVANALNSIADDDNDEQTGATSHANEETTYPSEVVTPTGEIVKLDQKAVHNSIMLGQMSRREILAKLNSNQQQNPAKGL